jgi:hypothetical protein
MAYRLRTLSWIEEGARREAGGLVQPFRVMNVGVIQQLRWGYARKHKTLPRIALTTTIYTDLKSSTGSF